jgi:thiol-disulfide isomerase/thioredoxin
MKNAMVSFMAAIYLLAAGVNIGYSQKTSNKVGDGNNETIEINKQSHESGWIPEARQWENRDNPYSSLTRKIKPIEKIEKKEIPLDFTPEQIKKDGNERKNYLVMISASWCLSCRAMYPSIKKLQKDGYIIYIFETTEDKYKNFDEEYKVKMYPTFIIYEDGQEVYRRTGPAPQDWFKERLKLKEDQEDQDEPIEPDNNTPVNPYDGL